MMGFISTFFFENSHRLTSLALDQDKDFHEEVRNAARNLINGVRLLRRGRFKQPDAALHEPRPK